MKSYCKINNVVFFSTLCALILLCGENIIQAYAADVLSEMF